jgi:Mg2+-importing ATPase
MRQAQPTAPSPEPDSYWTLTSTALLSATGSSSAGLTRAEAEQRLRRYGPNTLRAHEQRTALRLLLSQFRSPLVLILVFAAAISAAVQEWVDAAIVIGVVIASALLGFIQEYSASRAVEKLRAQVRIRAMVLRDGQPQAIPAAEVVPGDVVLLSAGSLIPADAVVLEAKDLFVNQAVLTGETFPVEKAPGAVPAAASLAERSNTVFMGTSVRSGTARALVVQTGMATAFGQIAARLTLRPPETEFERGIRRFGYLLTQVMLALVLAVFAINVFAAKPPIDSFLFAIALAVGLAPELLPAIISLNLAKGAQTMARRGVIVRTLNAIENFGSMDVLCTDKTGTITAGVVRLDGAYDAQGQPAPAVLRAAYLNAALQTGLANPLDEAVVGAASVGGLDRAPDHKLDEIPYDFVRKRLSVVVDDSAAGPRLITKGALANVLDVSRWVRVGDGNLPLDHGQRAGIEGCYAAWSEQGYRVLGVAERAVERRPAYTKADEQDLTFLGFLLFFDPPKPDVQQAIANLAALGVQLKIISGDNRLVAQHLAEVVGLPATSVLTGAELNQMRDEALWQAAERTTLFAEVDPNQKERIILALRKMGHVVGYLGDGINDAPALHAADVGLSVDSAVDVAKEAADFVLLKHDLDVLRAGIEEGRKTFANTLKYIFTTTSANFGNMFSMAGASLFLPFLPLLAKQILLNNFLSDFPGMTIAGDSVDPELVQRPRRWDIRFIRNFMVLFGLVSSVFDYMTFGLLLLIVRATPPVFRTAWFIESLLTELVIALVVRTRRPFYRSRPRRWLLVSTVMVTAVTLAVPYLPFSSYMGFVPLPAWLMLVLVGITGLYVLAAEIAKKYFYARWG